MVKEVAFFKGNRMSFYDVRGYYVESRLYMSRNELKLAISLRRRDSYNQYLVFQCPYKKKVKVIFFSCKNIFKSFLEAILLKLQKKAISIVVVLAFGKKKAYLKRLCVQNEEDCYIK